MYKTHLKHMFDVILAVVILLVTLPITLIVAVAIKLESKGPALFTQTRTGVGGKNFQLKKFRSMTANNDIYDLTKKNEVTKLGKFLRVSSIDEIPQLLNVIKGDMSFIGPRPFLPPFYEHMTEEQRERVSVRPGISGLAQVKGRNSITINEKINYDREYVKTISFMADVKIVLLTIVAVFEKAEQATDKQGIENELEVLRSQHGDGLTANEAY